MTAEADRPRATVLIIDDEPLIAGLLGELLETRGYSPTVRRSAVEALELLASREFDLIISDLRMPEMGGQEFHRLLLDRNPAMARCIIFMTGNSLDEEHQLFLGSTGAPHIAKPFRIDAIEKLVAETVAGIRKHAVAAG